MRKRLRRIGTVDGRDALRDRAARRRRERRPIRPPRRPATEEGRRKGTARPPSGRRAASGCASRTPSRWAQDRSSWTDRWAWCTPAAKSPRSTRQEAGCFLCSSSSEASRRRPAGPCPPGTTGRWPPASRCKRCRPLAAGSTPSAAPRYSEEEGLWKRPASTSCFLPMTEKKGERIGRQVRDPASLKRHLFFCRAPLNKCTAPSSVSARGPQAEAHTSPRHRRPPSRELSGLRGRAPPRLRRARSPRLRWRSQPLRWATSRPPSTRGAFSSRPPQEQPCPSIW